MGGHVPLHRIDDALEEGGDLLYSRIALELLYQPVQRLLLHQAMCVRS